MVNAGGRKSADERVPVVRKTRWADMNSDDDDSLPLNKRAFLNHADDSYKGMKLDFVFSMIPCNIHRVLLKL